MDISNSVLIQWFTGTTASKVADMVYKTLPTSFTNNKYKVVTMTYSTFESSSVRWVGQMSYYTRTTSSIKLHYIGANDSSYAVTYNAIAIGY